MGAKTGYLISSGPIAAAVVTVLADPDMLKKVADAYQQSPGTVGAIAAGAVFLSVLGDVMLHGAASYKGRY